jgi:UDP-glucuronate 4-epimerase
LKLQYQTLSTNQPTNKMTFPHVESMPVLHTGEEPDKSILPKQQEKETAAPPVARTSSTINLADLNEDEGFVLPHVGYKKVLVTGGAGFIGSHVAEFLLARGDDVVIVDEFNDYCTSRVVIYVVLC